MKPYAAAFLVLLGSLGADSAPHRSELKCENSPILFPYAPQTVYVINGKVSTREGVQGLKPESVESIEVVCAAALHSAFGIEAARAGVSVFTAPGPTTALRKEMESIKRLQNAYLLEHGAFANKLTDLDWSEPTGLIRIDLDTNTDGTSWSARGTHRYLMNQSSAVVTSGTRD